jgi:D-glycero-D-manno-heptose 1,7-bisphosphate phosphatase
VTRAIFIDRDGTINVDKGYLTDPDQIEFIDGSPEAISLANKWGLKVIVISNQSGVARGFMTVEQVDSVNIGLVERLKKCGAVVDAIYYCPHHPNFLVQDNKFLPVSNNDGYICSCRKPDVGMLFRAKKDFGIDLVSSFVVGDKWSDVQCGENAGAFTSLVLTGYGKTDHQRCIDDRIKIDYLAENLYDCVTNFVKKKIEVEN